MAVTKDKKEKRKPSWESKNKPDQFSGAMFPSRIRVVYDFDKAENAAKWRGVLVSSLRKILAQVHPSLRARDDALVLVEYLILQVLGALCAIPSPRSVEDVVKRVNVIFPYPADYRAISDYPVIGRSEVESIRRWKKKLPSILPTEKVHSLLQQNVLRYKVYPEITSYMVAILEWVSVDTLNFIGNHVRNIRHAEITYDDVVFAVQARKGLLRSFFFVKKAAGLSLAFPPKRTIPFQRPPTYEDLLRSLIREENQYVRDLGMAIKVFGSLMASLIKNPQNLKNIFGTVGDIYQLTTDLLKSLVRAEKFLEKKQIRVVGKYFEELAEGAAFSVYKIYVLNMICSQPLASLHQLLTFRQVHEGLHHMGQGYFEAAKYYLPKLLERPIWHFFVYVEFIKKLYRLSPESEDKQSLKNAGKLLRSLHRELKVLVRRLGTKGTNSPVDIGVRELLTTEKVAKLETCLLDENLGPWCKEFVREGILSKINYGRTLSERQVFLFDGVILLCKPKSKGNFFEKTTKNNIFEIKLKEKFFIKKVSVVDKEDTEDVKNAFEIHRRFHPKVVLVAKSAEEKNNWMADLIILKMKTTLDSFLNDILLNEEENEMKMRIKYILES